MCKRTMYKRARIPMFLWERRACANSGAQPRPFFSSPPQKRPGNEASTRCTAILLVWSPDPSIHAHAYSRLIACASGKKKGLGIQKRC